MSNIQRTDDSIDILALHDQNHCYNITSIWNFSLVLLLQEDCKTKKINKIL